MNDQVEFSAAIHSAMQEKNLDREALAQKLGVDRMMVDKIMRGDIVPSRHLERQMIEVLQIEPARVKRVVARRQARTKTTMNREAQTGKAA